MTEQHELLPCPCCGGPVKWQNAYTAVRCTGCALIFQGYWSDSPNSFAEKFNTRPAPAVEVEPLDWQQGTSKSDRSAHCECGIYAVAKIDGAWHAIRRFVDSEQQMEDEVIGMADNRALAMQDCEDDRSGRILSALPPQPPLSPQDAAKVLLEAKNRDGLSVLPHYVLDQLKAIAGGQVHE